MSMQVFIQWLSRPTPTTISMESSSLVEDMKAEICKKEEDLYPDQFHLIFHGRYLEYGRKLQDYDIQNESKVFLVLRVPMRAYETINIKLSTPTDCSICFELLTRYITLPCKHAFHDKCINHWFTTQRQMNALLACPMCRQLCEKE